MRSHYRTKAKEKDKVALLVRSVRGHLVRAPTPCRIVWTRVYCGNPMDWVNAAASFKHLEDVLVSLGVLIDDSPKYVHGLDVRQVRVAHKTDIGAMVVFEPAATRREGAEG
jgi:hypothetical protein